MIVSAVGKRLKSPRVVEEQLRVARRLKFGSGLPICAPPNIALQRTPSAAPPSPLSFGTLGDTRTAIVRFATLSQMLVLCNIGIDIGDDSFCGAWTERLN